MPLQAEHQPRHKGEGSLHRASFLRQAQAQEMAEQTPLGQLALEEKTGQTESLAEKALPQHFALEGETSQKTSPKHPPDRQAQLDLEQLEQTMLEIERLQKVVRKLVRHKLPPTLAAELAENECKQESDSNSNNNNNNNNTDNNNNNTTNTNNNNNNNNNEPNNYNDNNKNSQELSLNSFDLDNDNPESEPDLDSPSFGCFNPNSGS